eukprot:gene7885-biopygen6087
MMPLFALHHALVQPRPGNTRALGTCNWGSVVTPSTRRAKRLTSCGQQHETRAAGARNVRRQPSTHNGCKVQETGYRIRGSRFKMRGRT